MAQVSDAGPQSLKVQANPARLLNRVIIAIMKKLKIKTRKLGRERIGGKEIWAYYDANKELIEIDARLKGKKHLKIYCHELIHCAFPEATEYQVKIAAKLLSEYLWMGGYRKLK